MIIVYCISGTFNSGGMERVLTNKANYLVRQGYDISIITTDQKGRKPYFTLDPRIDQHDLGINYKDDLDKGLLTRVITYFRKQRKHRKALSTLLKKLNADIAISMFDHDGSFLHKIKDGSKKVMEIHFSRFKRIQYNRKGVWKWIDLFRAAEDLNIVKQYDKFVVLTQEDKEYWGDIHHMTVIPNANSFVTDQQALLETKNVIAVGRYDYQKGFDNLIRIWQQVHQVHPDWMLNIYGQGPLKEYLQQIIDELKLSEVIHLCAPVKNIEQEYLNSSMLVMTSRYEGFGLALTEAQTCGLPLIAYACKCGPRDIIRKGYNGFLIAEDDERNFAEKINLLIENDNLRREMGKNAVEMSQRYSETVVMQQWLNLFNGLSGQ
ncbi:glycosyltransferase family 4 protein [Sphingobacterium spiritivorum]|uniref:glycosyltransferase family 4 protein n=1 Tax=Sphingobacterium spiritivorum TaxID=258 RepID=UPI00191B3F2A|nr:glycosyltransferase family 4 protein [Sphingobacterium spiritivorum]QQT25882.1 glycosyltransferase family 4 protein [Sphingobacterium spiritivorum]